MNEETIKAKLDELKREKERLIAQVNFILGQIDALEFVLNPEPPHEAQ